MDVRMIIFMGSMLLPLTLFTFFRRFLDQQKNQKLLSTTFYVLAAIGIVLTILKGKSYLYYLLLLFPLFSYWVYRFSLFWFRKKIGRDPIDTAMDWRNGLKWDRVFNIGYVILGIIIPFIIFTLIINQ